jgi:glycosyltransferase involved in cell wall biosynthesis
MPIISIIVPVYNVEPYLRECLDSVLAQTFTDYECILVNDGSPDNCPAICDEYAVKYHQMKVIHQVNGGLSDARNTGILAAVGEYIVLLDSDDLFAANDALEHLNNVIVKTKASVIFNSNLTTFKDSEVIYKSYDGIDETIDHYKSIDFYKKTMLNQKILLAAWTFSVERTFLLHHNLFFKKGIVHEDEHWMPRVICAAEMLAINHRPFYAYRQQRANSIMSQIMPRHLFDKFIIIEELLALSETQKKQGNNNLYTNWCCKLWYSIFYSIPVIEKTYKYEYKKIIRKLRRFSYLLLYEKRVKNILKFFGISLFGIQFILYTWKRYMQFRQMLRHLLFPIFLSKI